MGIFSHILLKVNDIEYLILDFFVATPCIYTCKLMTMFRRNVLNPLQGCDPEEGGRKFLRNVGIHIEDRTASQPTRLTYKFSLPWKLSSDMENIFK
jgi:hypothetical protein